ncbi:MAG: major capsid protein [Selenomonadaceae bacterium]|nr:major capsid protein [Selenomonadaceae bacterium]
MQNPFAITDTYELVKVVERIKAPASYLINTLFPGTRQIMRDVLPIEYSKQGRRLAPFLVKGSRGVNIAREKTTIKLYQAPLMGARRVIGLDDIERRSIGEQPVFSTKTAEERAAELQARDLLELKRMLTNRRAAMVAELIQTGKITVKAFADDGNLATGDEIEFEGFQKLNKNWSVASAKIADDLLAASETIQESSGFVPDLLLCGKNVFKYMRDNTQFEKFLLNSNPNALAWLNFTPKYLAPQVRFIGYVASLGLEIVSYTETFVDDDGTTKPFIDDDTCILCRGNIGELVYGTMNYLDPAGQWQSAAAQEVPVYTHSYDAQTTSLTLYSRCLPIPTDISDFIAIKTAS